MKSWDIFCRVVDNFGDIGVTWRLARQLSTEFNQQVRLFVDDLEAFKYLCPEIDPSRESQEVLRVQILRWHPRLDIEPADVVIEAFGCPLPKALITAMAQRTPPSRWINLEYLSAESWVGSCHLLPSPQRVGPDKYFFFPGFNNRISNSTGGLLREQNLLDERDQFAQDQQRRFLLSLGVNRDPAHQLVSVFTYENPQIGSWLDSLRQGELPYHLLVPPGRIANDIRNWLKIDKFETGMCLVRGQLRIQAIPFLSQQAYDHLLWCCDLNLVRGEDSFVRAQWAAKPFVWHIYKQDDDVHLEKLNAFLDLYLKDLDADTADAVVQLWTNWNQQQPLQQSWNMWQKQRDELNSHAKNWCSELAQQKSLAQALSLFVQI